MDRLSSPSFPTVLFCYWPIHQINSSKCNWNPCCCLLTISFKRIWNFWIFLDRFPRDTGKSLPERWLKSAINRCKWRGCILRGDECQSSGINWQLANRITANVTNRAINSGFSLKVKSFLHNFCAHYHKCEHEILAITWEFKWKMQFKTDCGRLLLSAAPAIILQDLWDVVNRLHWGASFQIQSQK